MGHIAIRRLAACFVLAFSVLLGVQSHAGESSGSKFHLPGNAASEPINYLESAAEAGEGGEEQQATWAIAESVDHLHQDLANGKPFILYPRDTALTKPGLTFRWTPVHAGDGRDYGGETDLNPAADRYKIRIRLGAPWGQVVWETSTSRTSIRYPLRSKPLIAGRRYSWQVMAVDKRNVFLHTGSSFFTVPTPEQLKAVAAAKSVFDAKTRSGKPQLENYFQLLSIYQQANMTDEMLRLIRAGLKDYPSCAELYQAQGEIYRRIGRSDDSARSLKKAVDLEPNNEPKDAIQRLRLAVQRDPKNANARLDLAGAIQSASASGGADRRAEIIAQLRTAVQLAPDNAMAHLSLGRALTTNVNGVRHYSPEAVSQFAAYVTLFCQQLNSRYYRMRWNTLTTQLEEAVGILLEQNSHLAEAEQALATLERLGFNDYATRWVNAELSQCYAKSGKFPEAIARMRKVIALDVRQESLPENVRWDMPLASDRTELAKLDISTGNYDEAIKLYRQAIEWYFENSPGSLQSTYTDLAGVYKKKGMNVEADRALSDGSSSALVLRYKDMGARCLKQSQYAKAEHYYQNAYDIGQSWDRGQINKLLGDVYAKWGKRDQAIERYTWALQSSSCLEAQNALFHIDPWGYFRGTYGRWLDPVLKRNLIILFFVVEALLLVCVIFLVRHGVRQFNHERLVTAKFLVKGVRTRDLDRHASVLGAAAERERGNVLSDILDSVDSSEVVSGYLVAGKTRYKPRTSLKTMMQLSSAEEEVAQERASQEKSEDAPLLLISVFARVRQSVGIVSALVIDKPDESIGWLRKAARRKLIGMQFWYVPSGLNEGQSLIEELKATDTKTW